ncbi:MAG: hypothetical protein JW990_05370 [Thermoleophilia bacterium]|nr:hypothetical protein [Thermoleophilia bacterium]
MSRRSKSILVAVLAVVLALAVAVPAFAAVETPAGTPAGAGYGGQGHGAMFGGGAGVRGIDAAATALNMDAADLAAERQAGKSLADVAASKGMSTESLISALLATREAALADAVTSGRITQEQADYMLDNMRANIADHIDDTEVGPRGGSRGFGGQGMRGACGGSCQ